MRDKLSDTEQWIISYLLEVMENEGDRFVSPTEIGNKYNPFWGHSGWASPRCLRLTEWGWLQRSKEGWYRIAPVKGRRR